MAQPLDTRRRSDIEIMEVLADILACIFIETQERGEASNPQLELRETAKAA